MVSEDRDVIIHAYTGSGKTLAYLLPLIASIDPEIGTVQVLVFADDLSSAFGLCYFEDACCWGGVGWAGLQQIFMFR